MFGGDWTTDKLNRVRKYLSAYTTIMRKQKFNQYIYIDAFAGTGWLTLKQNENSSQSYQLSLFESDQQENPDQALAGSARIALQVDPPFSQYIFVEKDRKRFGDLVQIKAEYPNRNIIIENSDANPFIQDICERQDWIKNGMRAVLFLDPYGMQVPWTTIEAIARTQAIDLWYLFPLGVALNRLLKKDGKINVTNQRKIDDLLGNKDWYDLFYTSRSEQGLFGEETRIEKIANFELIKEYFVKQLQSIFPGVAENPRLLYNSKNNPLYLLCFASANPKGAPTAVKIAQDILKRS